ncbi:hypothetical protein ED236_00430 [Pseudomethylobacillus aquaticus]|uniref:Putative phage metallopeptidase domain-containing protein n=1 Tax=Pseudomethylobacillus aquaticus TaxID=2676064 RepID=A0A3N0V5Z3_9PROT|nr:putative metallopeptidase [Pseudomethylobacillus aquaticus]ROH87994.1 hypothetical protein ED236_00430 [Pseudomethylobacillus aquaticus]
MNHPKRLRRPHPPRDLGGLHEDVIISVCPALDMPAWVHGTFIADDASLHNPDHQHLFAAMDGDVGFLWASGAYVKHGRQVHGQTEQLAFRAGGWQKMRMEQQFMQWFGMHLPSFIITLDAGYCGQASDAEFCALVEHELYHIAQATNNEGMPAFHRDTGNPRLTLRGHDVEEFYGVVRRYGANPEVAELARLAAQKPEVSRVSIASACGNCLKLVA